MSTDKRWSMGDLVQMLSRADPSKVERALRPLIEKRGLVSPYNREEVLWLLGELASEQGLLAVVARFAKVRLILN
jgi:hypothetical protein